MPSGKNFAAIAIHSGLPPGSSSGAGDLLRRILGRAGAGCSASSRRRDRGLCVVLLSRRHRCWPARSNATADRHSRAGFGFPAAGQGAPGSPARPAADPSSPARRFGRREQPAGRATGHRGLPSADGPACPRLSPTALLQAATRAVRSLARYIGSSMPLGSPPQSPGPSRSSPAIAIKASASMAGAAVLQAPPDSCDGRIPCSRSRCQPSQRQ